MSIWRKLLGRGCASGLLICLAAAPVATYAQGSAPARRSEYLVFSKCKDGLKAQCDSWYQRHIVGFKQIEGVVSAREYSITPGVGRNAMGKDRMVVYELSGDPAAVIARLGPAAAAGKLLAPDTSLFVMPFESVVVELTPR